jgi:NAD(P)-dependent dehydrogenase (short-subunit alcohol dehydrogenase family)
VLGNAGQTNYGAAKAGIAAFSTICAMELGRYGVRSNAITPMARTRLTEQTPGLEDVVRAPTDAAKFDAWDPANISPMIAYLGTADCPFTGETFFVQGDVVARYQPYVLAETISNHGVRWTVERLIEEGPKLAPGDERRGGPGELGRISA